MSLIILSKAVYKLLIFRLFQNISLVHHHSAGRGWYPPLKLQITKGGLALCSLNFIISPKNSATANYQNLIYSYARW